MESTAVVGHLQEGSKLHNVRVQFMKLTNLINLGMTTNFVNPSYPGTDSTTGECKFYLVLNSDVCQVSLAELFFENIAMRDSGSSGLC